MLAAGFIQSAISPTVLVTGMLELQRQNYGADKSRPLASQPLKRLDSPNAFANFFRTCIIW